MSAQATPEDDVVSEVDAVLSLHDGDARAAIAALIEECQQLRHALALMEAASSIGFTRGWRPRLDFSLS